MVHLIRTPTARIVIEPEPDHVSVTIAGNQRDATTFLLSPAECLLMVVALTRSLQEDPTHGH